MPLIGRDAILNAQDLPYEDVNVPEWGGIVRIRTITGAQRDQFEQSLVEASPGTPKPDRRRINMRNLRARLVAMSAVDEEGNCLFTDQDVEALGRKSARALDRLFDVAQRLSGLSNTDVKDLVENFAEGQQGGVTSA